MTFPTLPYRRSGRLALVALAACVSIALGGCASLGLRQSQPSGMDRPAAASVDAGFNFDWSVSGSPEIRPVQVFSDTHKTYIQMRAGQRIPEVIVNGVPVPFSISPPNLIVEGDPALIDLVSNGLRAVLVNGQPLSPQVPVDPSRVQFVALGPNGHPVASALPMRSIAPAQVQPEQASRSRAPLSSPSAETTWYISSGDRLLSMALANLLAQHGKQLEWKTPVDLPVLQSFGVRANGSLVAVAKILALASQSTGYRYFFSIRGDTYVVTAEKA